MSRPIVLIAVDPSQEAESAFRWYLDHIHRPGNSVIIVHCVDLSTIIPSGSMETSRHNFQQLWGTQRGKIKRLEDKYRWQLNERGVSGRIRTETGKPGQAVVETAKEENAGLIVIGSRGLGKVRRTFLGSVSDYVLHHAHCPVIICPPKSLTNEPEVQGASASH